MRCTNDNSGTYQYDTRAGRSSAKMDLAAARWCRAAAGGMVADAQPDVYSVRARARPPPATSRLARQGAVQSSVDSQDDPCAGVACWDGPERSRSHGLSISHGTSVENSSAAGRHGASVFAARACALRVSPQMLLRIRFSNSSRHSQARLLDLAAPFARVLPSTSRSLKAEGAGNAGRSMHPQPRVQHKKAHEHSHHGHTGKSPGIPRAMVLTAYTVLSPVTGLSCHRRPARFLARLDTSVGASGPHGFVVRLKRLRLWRHPRPPHPASRP
jgi:hypothetical protein